MQTLFTAPPHDQVLALLVQITILLFSARALAEVAQRLGQPAVVGEILAGMILGPSLLSGFFPGLGEWVVPQSREQGYLLEVVSMLGAILLLLITGLETDLALIRRRARLSIGASLGGIVVPFATGFLLGAWLPDSLLADPRQRLVFSLFVATAMSISAIPVIAKVLMDLNLMRRDIGQAIIAAGMTDDAIGWMLLSVVVGLASSGEVAAGTVVWSVVKVLGFMAFSFTVGLWLVRRALDFVQDRAVSPMRILTLVVVLATAWGAASSALGLEAVFGAFVVGILFTRMPRLPSYVRHDLERMTLGVFAPIFFAVAGLKVDARALLQPRLIGIALLVIAVASIGKVVGGYVGARWVGGSTHWEALSFGAGMNARGAMEIIVASIGLSLGILSRDMFSIIVVMALVTSLLAPPALRWTLRRVTLGEEERQRLKREEMEEGSLIAGVRRVLIPVRCREDERRTILTLETSLLNRLAERNPLAVTLLTVTTPGSKLDAVGFQERLANRFSGVELSRKVVEGRDATQVILDEAAKDYDLVMVGAPGEDEHAADLFTARIDQLLRLSPCPTAVVRGRVSRHNWPPRCILVPTDGSLASRRAADLAFLLAGDGGQVLLLNVMEEIGDPVASEVPGLVQERQLNAARDLMGELQSIADTHSVRTATRVTVSAQPEAVVLETAARDGMDLVILGTSIYPASKHLYLGPQLERILNGVGCPIVLLNST